MAHDHPEISNVKVRYARRTAVYDPLAEWMIRIRSERQRVYAQLLREARVNPGSSRLLEIGCGSGQNLLFFLQLGFLPVRIVGNELLEERQKRARQLLPQDLQIIGGDAREISVAEVGQFEIVTQHLVFSSLLDDAFREQLAQKMWELTAPGGGVLWYDMRIGNPRNPDVRKITGRRIRELFPEGRIRLRSVTLPPPVAKLVCAISGALYPVVGAVPAFRSHIAAWIQKP